MAEKNNNGLIDFDGLFDRKLTDYMKKNGGKRTEKEWENLIPELYEKFGDAFLPKIGCSPRQYYARMTDETLVETLCGHLQGGVPVPEFLCAEVEKRRPTEKILAMLDSADEETFLYAVHFIGADERAFDKYFDILEKGVAGEDAENEVTEQLKIAANAVKDRALNTYRVFSKKAETQSGEEAERAEKTAEYALEILSRATERSDEIFETLLAAFSAGGEKTPMRASYLAAYGDERALPVLLKRIESREIGFVEFRELKYAIEALGGEYNEPRTFDDEDFIKVENQSAKEGFSEIGDLS